MNNELIPEFERLAHENRTEVQRWIETFDPRGRRGLLIEVCRALDFAQVQHTFGNMPIPYPDFDLMLRGWNFAMGSLFTADYFEQGIPIRTSTEDTLRVARSLLHKLGLSALLSKTANIMKAGMAEATRHADAIYVRSTSFSTAEHFMDQIEVHRLAKLEQSVGLRDSPERLSKQEMQKKLADLLFPWDTPYGRMIGYDADPALDEHFLSLMSESVLDWRVHAGIHPDTQVGGVSGALLTGIVSLLAAIALKHIHFVSVGNSILPKVNYAMSLTIWKTRDDLTDSLTAFTGESRRVVGPVLDRIIATPAQAKLHSSSETPYLPLLIQVSQEQLLAPISGIFRNPLQGIRNMLEATVPNAENLIRQPREAWMKKELDALFSGTRYQTISRPVMIKSEGKTLTDIDAAVLDINCQCLALFQLKWQDFGNFDVRRQRSQAKNFVSSTEEWAQKIHAWLGEHSLDEMTTALQLKGTVRSIRLFAIGKFAGHFKSYGVSIKDQRLAACSWPHFVRLRWEIGPVPEVISKLHDSILQAEEDEVIVKAIPHRVQVCGQTIVFENTWNDYDDAKSD